MKIKYIGSDVTEVFGLIFKPGETIDVTDAYASEKLRFNPRFEVVDAKDKAKKGDTPQLIQPSEALTSARDRITEETNKTIMADIERKKREG